ncbi:FERM domain-containing protein 6 [Clupea harengus]|uniref:FERM domain-containing protein 6 n=1 Tax=Clupea harengus TaxID=7950 RepID=A0A6P3VIN6_CLUHA|nr:FERM domain-containing protein 6 [Clupea harengus]
MSASAKQERSVCVLLPTKEQLDITVGVKSTGQEVLNQISQLLYVKELHFFGLTVVKDNEHIYLDLEEKLTKYFPKEWKQESGKGPQKRIPLLLFLKVQFYVENGRLISERKARQLYFADLRERVLRSECRQQEEVYFQLAGYALQADLPDHPTHHLTEEDTPKTYFQPKDYFPPWIVAKRGVDYLLRHGPNMHRELWGMPSRDAILLFIRESCRLEDVPVTFYRLQKDKREDRGSALLGLTLRGMQVYQEVNNMRQLLYDFPWSNVGRLTFLGKKFEIQPDGLPSARKLVYYTGSAFRSRHLLLHLSSSHQLYLSLQPALTHLRQLDENEEKKRYRESYISDDLDLDPQGSDGSPRLSRRSTSSSGIEADTRQRSVSVEMTSMDEEGLRQTEEKSFSSAASLGSSHTSGVDTGSKARADEDEWQEEETQVRVSSLGEVSVDNPGEVSVDDPQEMLQLAELLEGVSVDCPSFMSEMNSTGIRTSLVDMTDSHMKHGSTDTLGPVINWKTRTSVDRHSQSLDDIHLFSPPTPLGTLPQANTSHSYTFGLPESHISLKNHQHPITQCPAKPSFYGRRSTNCLSLDLLEDEQLLELIL